MRSGRRACTLAATIGLLLPAAAVAAAGDIPFTDGPGSATRLAAYLNRQPTIADASCRYQKPLVRCHGLIRAPKTDVYVRFRMAVHKTAAKRGYQVTCIDPWSTGDYGFCRRQPMTFSR
jgi:hypothetical protein